jgi:hypothetical protein
MILNRNQLNIITYSLDNNIYINILYKNITISKEIENIILGIMMKKL